MVCDRLEQQGWTIIHRQWRCRFGELDIIATQRQDLRFIEVKTRSSNNWDKTGALSISPQKQHRCIKTALVFLQHHPNFAEHNCSFDVALVSKQGHDYQLYRYIQSAFEL